VRPYLGTKNSLSVTLPSLSVLLTVAIDPISAYVLLKLVVVLITTMKITLYSCFYSFFIKGNKERKTETIECKLGKWSNKLEQAISAGRHNR